MGLGGFLGTVIGWCLITVGMLVGAWWLRHNDAEFRANALRAIATVVANGRDEHRDKRNRKTYSTYDVYEFTAANGQRVQFTSQNTSLRSAQRVGAQAQIMYDPNDPNDARLADAAVNRAATLLVWLSPLGLVIAGVVALIWMKTRP